MKTMRFREARCGFLEVGYQECLEKEFNNHEIHERVLFSDECCAVQGSEMWFP